MKMNLRTPPNYGWVETTLDKEHIDFLWERIEDKQHSSKDRLAGNINGSFELEDKNDYFFKEVLIPHIDAYSGTIGNKHPVRDHLVGEFDLYLQSLWVNFQNKHEFNPYHDHGGVYSFAIWLKIPTDWKEQNKLPFLDGMKEDDKKPSNFEFEYLDLLGGVKNYGYRLSASEEGKMLFFPAKLRHTVYPFFNTDEQRISVAGNVWYKIRE